MYGPSVDVFVPIGNAELRSDAECKLDTIPAKFETTEKAKAFIRDNLMAGTYRVVDVKFEASAEVEVVRKLKLNF